MSNRLATIILLFIFAITLVACSPNLHLRFSRPVVNAVGVSGQTQLGSAYNQLNVVMVKLYYQGKADDYDNQMKLITTGKKALWKLSILRDNLAVSLRSYEKEGQYSANIPFGKELVKSAGDMLLQSVRYLNVTKGYVQAHLDHNLSYLTGRNEKLFNGLSKKVSQSDKVFLKDLGRFSASPLGHIRIPDKIIHRGISLTLDEGAYPKEGARLQALFKKRLEKYGFVITSAKNPMLVIKIDKVRKETSLDVAKAAFITFLIPSTSLWRTHNKLLVTMYLKRGNQKCSINFLNGIDMSMDSWEKLENFLVGITVDELQYGSCFSS